MDVPGVPTQNMGKDLAPALGAGLPILRSAFRPFGIVLGALCAYGNPILNNIANQFIAEQYK